MDTVQRFLDCSKYCFYSEKTHVARYLEKKNLVMARNSKNAGLLMLLGWFLSLNWMDLKSARRKTEHLEEVKVLHASQCVGWVVD